MRSYPQTWPMDLRSDGKTQVTLTPGTAEQTASFKITAPKGSVGDKYTKLHALNGRLAVGFDQAASGGSVVNWDDLPRAIKGLQINSELLGILANKETTNGPLLKHIIEFVGNAYNYAGDRARTQIASADGDTALSIYFQFPFVPAWAHRAEDFALWVGWLHNTEITFSLGATTCYDAVSTGAVIEATCNVQMWLDYFVSDELNIPVLNHWNLYRQNAGGTEFRLDTFCGPHGLEGVQNYARVAGLYQLSSLKGMGGCLTFDALTSFACDQLGLKTVNNVDGFVKAYKALVGGRKGPITTTGSATLHDGATNPETMEATPNGALNSATLMYLAIFAPSPTQKLTKLPKWNAGDLQYVEGFSSTPSSGQNLTLANEIREFEPAKKIELMQRAGLDPKTQQVYAKKKYSEKQDALPSGKAKGLPDKVGRKA